MIKIRKGFQNILRYHNQKRTVLFFLLLCITANTILHAQKSFTITESLKITKINESSYLHVSDITLENGSVFPCNGFVYVHNNEAYVFDTPATDKATSSLLDWLQNDLKVKVKGVVFNHYHNDATEGINIFKSQGIPTIASEKTALLMHDDNQLQPDVLFKNTMTLTLGSKKIINTFFGEGHTSDNITSYFPDEQLIFGGCMIKSINASKGNLANANLNQWPKTVSKIKKAYPNLKIVIPGHGAYGDSKLLDYTITLFQTEK